MKCCCSLLAILVVVAQLVVAADQPEKPLASGLKHPAAVASGPGGKIYVALAGEAGKEGTGSVAALVNGQAVPFATGLEDPRAMVSFRTLLFVADKNRILRIDAKGKAAVVVDAKDFPKPPIDFRSLAVDYENGKLYVSDAGDKNGKGGAVYSIAQMLQKGFKGQKGPANQKPQIGVVTDQTRWPELKRPNGLVIEGQSNLLLVDGGTGKLYRINLSTGYPEKLAEGFGSGDGLAWDKHGRLFISDGKAGKVFVIGRPGASPVLFAQGFKGLADLSLDPTGKLLLVADSKAGTITALRPRVPGAEVDESPLEGLESVHAFPKLHWTDWKSETKSGKSVQLRPIVLTHAGDGSNRVFVATQQGVIHVFPNDAKAEKTEVFLDIQKKVTYLDNQNEEGLLGLAFHPQYKKNGEFFVFYTLKQGRDKHTNIVSRFRVSKDNPNRAEPGSEEELLRIEHKNWNHDGGTLCFGPDGYLYTNTGDGGSANDPDNNGQNLKSWLAKIFRIDVDHKDPGKNYAVPKDNPFVGRADALPEVWAYGLRNVWRMAFDRKTGQLWAGDVGQNLFEEIDIIVKGGNYGWKLREGLHPFGTKGVGPRKDLIDPIWEFHHSLGLCIIGGNVYRGPRLPELDGAYIYADYLSGKVWAVRYDETAKRVVANRPIRTPGQPILSFGEDQQGETYFLVSTTSPGAAIFRIQHPAAVKGP